MQAYPIYEQLVSILGDSLVKKDVSMKDYTSIKTGGIVDYLVEPDSPEKVVQLIKLVSGMGAPYYVMGNGSNLIISDEGFEGVIIKIGSKLSAIKVDGQNMTAQAGASLAAVSAKAWEESLTGLEFASGIPGTIGGAAAMNAGAYDGEMSQVITTTTSVDANGNVVLLSGQEHEFGYRHSRIMEMGLTVLEVSMALNKGDKKAIRDKMNDLNARRRDKQPLEMPSAGSVFKRPEGYFAGKLIQDCELRGCTMGGAQVSEKHCGFIVNTGNASSQDIINLINHIKETVYNRMGVQLEPEVKIIGGRKKCSS